MKMINKQLLKILSYKALLILALAEGQAQEKDEKQEMICKKGIFKNNVESQRKDRMCLLGFDEFDNSFNIKGHIKQQMENRKAVWKDLSLGYVKQGHMKEIIEYSSNQVSLVTYIPYYLKEILDIKSASELKLKTDFFSDFINLIDVSYKYLDNKKLRVLNGELAKINLEQYPLSSIFSRFSALKEGNMEHYDLFPALRDKVGKIWLDEKFNGPKFLYHKCLKDKCEKDKDFLELLSDREFSEIELKQLILLHNSIYD